MSQRHGARRCYQSPLVKQLKAEEACLHEALKLIKEQRIALEKERIALEIKKQLLLGFDAEELLTSMKSEVQLPATARSGSPPDADDENSLPSLSRSDLETVSQSLAENEAPVEALKKENEKLDKIENPIQVEAVPIFSGSMSEYDVTSQSSDEDEPLNFINSKDAPAKRN